MSDFLTKEKRSALMSRVRGHNTSPERYVRNRLWSSGFRYRLNVRGLPGSPDLVLPRYRIAVFVHGCFWHRHECPKGRRFPSTNHEFWRRKLENNMARDVASQSELQRLGWTVYVVWNAICEQTLTLC